MRTLILSVLIATSGCNFEEARRDGKSKIPVYEIICRHPKKGFVSHYVRDNHANIRPYKFRNSVWFFKDVKGILVETSMGCYTDSTTKGFIKK